MGTVRCKLLYTGGCRSHCCVYRTYSSIAAAPPTSPTRNTRKGSRQSTPPIKDQQQSHSHHEGCWTILHFRQSKHAQEGIRQVKMLNPQEVSSRKIESGAY